MKKTRYFLEATLLYTLFTVFKLMGLDRASAMGGWIGRHVGPKLAASRKAERNLEHAFPHMEDTERARIIIGMWENLGRIFAEYPHLKYITDHRITLKGGDVFVRLKDRAQGAVFFSAHMGNWEINGGATLIAHDRDVRLTYRAPNNPFSDRLLMKSRLINSRIQASPKTRGSAREMLRALKTGEYIGILIDQKYNEGVEVPFFDRLAMTNPIFVQLCQKQKCALIPMQNKRLKGAHFEITFYEPLELFDENGNSRPVEDVVIEAHHLLEGWIREAPEQWLWLHRRWGEKKLETSAKKT